MSSQLLAMKTGQRIQSPGNRDTRRRTQKTYTETEVIDALDGAVASGQDLVQTVRDILEESQGGGGVGGGGGENCRLTVFTHCVELLNSDQLQNQTAQELVGKLLIEVESLSGSSIVTVTELLIDCVKKGTVDNGRSLELLPKLLSVISTHSQIRHQRDGGGVDVMDGPDFKSHLLNSLCGCKWASSSVLHVANMCRDILMSEDELKFLIEKILRVMDSLPYQELPPLAYQLLVLSTRGHKSLVLDGLQSLFNKLDKKALQETEEEEESESDRGGGGDTWGGVSEVGSDEKELLLSEGTVILHITFALKQDQELGKKFLESLKTLPARVSSSSSSSSSSLSPFSLALALSVVRIHRFEDAVFDSLKMTIMKSFKDQDRCTASRWIQNVCGERPDLERCILRTIEHSKCGWDHVVEGLVMLGFHLMDTCATKTSSVQLRSPQYRVCCLGSKILSHCSKAHSIVHGEVISQLINRILTNSSSYITHYIALVADVIEMTPQLALDSLPQLKDAFSYLSVLPPSSATDLLEAVLPLVQFSSSVRDSLLLVLRKSLFSRQVDVRKIAVGGYLLLLKKFTVLSAIGVESQLSQTSTSSQSQIEVEVHRSASQSGFQTLCLELLGTLKRSLSQQCEVKITLYQGLCEVLRSNPQLAEPIIELLLTQLMVYYEKEKDTKPPLKLESCITTSTAEVQRTEPLDQLVHCLQMCVTEFVRREERGAEQGVESEGQSEVVEEAREVLDSLVERMIVTQLDDFELDRSADFSSNSSVGQKNRITAKFVTGLYETLMEYTFTSGDFSPESCEQCLQLFHCYQRVAHILSEKSAGSSSGGASGSGRRGPASSPPGKKDGCILSLRFTVDMLQALFVDVIPNHQQALSVLRNPPNSLAFGRYILTSATHHIHQIQTKGVCEGVIMLQSKREEKVFRLLCSLGKPLFKQLQLGGSGGGGGGGGQGKKDKGKSIPVLCLEGFSQLLQVVDSRYPSKMATFLSRLHPDSTRTPNEEKIHFFIRHFQEVVSGVITGSSSRGWSMREVNLMVNMISCLATHLPSSSSQLEQVCGWTVTLCRENSVDDSHVTKALVGQLLTLNNRYKENVKILRKLAQDVHYHLGDIDEDIELEFRPHFAIVNPRTASASILGLVYSHMEQALGDCDWLIARLKTELTTPNHTSSPDESGSSSSQEGLTQSESHCSSLCERLMNLVVGCHELVQSAVSPGTPTDGLLKTVTKLYETLGSLAKYYVGLYAFVFHLIPNFKKLVEMVGTHLSQQVYALISYIQVAQSMSTDQRTDKKKGGKGKGKTGSGKVNVHRESRLFPSLVFAMEQFEKFLIQLSKKSKVNLMENFKRSMARDFRINHQAVDAILNEGEEEEGEEEEEERVGEEGDEEGGENRPPLSKRLKI